MRTGDTVRHIPSGELWTVAWADSHELIACGWPETIARPSDCVLVEACSDEEYWELLHKIAHGRSNTYRQSMCFATIEQRNREECARMMRL